MHTGSYTYGEELLSDVGLKVYKTPKIDFKYPIKIGTQWSGEEDTEAIGEGGDFSVPMSCNISSIDEEITVASGNYKNCFMVKCRGSRKKKNIRSSEGVLNEVSVDIVTYAWYAPETGMVKYIKKEKGSIFVKRPYYSKYSEYKVDTIMQLKSFISPPSSSLVDKVKNIFE